MPESVQQISSDRKLPMHGSSARWALFAVVVVMLATLFSPPFLRMLGPNAWKAFDMTEAQWSVVTAVRGLFFIIFILAAGVLADFQGRRRVLLLTLAAFTFLTLAITITPVGNLSLIFYALLSILGVMIRTLTVTLLILMFEQRQRLTGLVIYSVFSGGAYLLSPYISIAIFQDAGAKMLFVLPAVFAVAGFWLVVKKIPESHASAEGNRKDVIAVALFSFDFCVLIFAAILAGSLGWTHPIVLTGFAIGGGLLLLLNVLDDLSVNRSWQFNLHFERQLSIAIFAGVILHIALYAIALQVFNFLRKVQGYNLKSAILMLAPILAGAFLTGILATRLIHRLKVRRALAFSLFVVALPAIGLSFLSPDVPYWVIALHLFVLGFGFILGNSPYLMLLTSSVPLDLIATVQSIGSAANQLGAALAHSFILTLLLGFGQRAYVELLEKIGLSPEEITERILALATASEDISLVIPPETQAEIVQSSNYFLRKAYVTGLSQAMLTLAGVCVFSAILVYVGLRSKKRSKT